jgi:hypothetical protein
MSCSFLHCGGKGRKYLQKNQIYNEPDVAIILCIASFLHLVESEGRKFERKSGLTLHFNPPVSPDFLPIHSLKSAVQ